MISLVNTGPSEDALAKGSIVKSQPKCYNVNEPILSVDEYRKMLSDNQSTDEQILKRIQFIEGLCQKIIKLELEDYVSQHQTRK